MDTYRTEIHGHLIEARRGSLGGEYVLLNGRMMSERPFAGWRRRPHFLDLTDEQGKQRHVEVRVHDQSGLGLSYCVVICVDGVERVRLAADDKKKKGGDACYNCGYLMTGLVPENGEVRCPECGRHTAAKLLNLRPPESKTA